MREEGQEATQPTGYTVTSRSLRFALRVASVWEGTACAYRAGWDRAGDPP